MYSTTDPAFVLKTIRDFASCLACIQPSSMNRRCSSLSVSGLLVNPFPPWCKNLKPVGLHQTQHETSIIATLDATNLAVLRINKRRKYRRPSGDSSISIGEHKNGCRLARPSNCLSKYKGPLLACLLLSQGYPYREYP